ncbi:hypothetical protein HN011_002299 [Eciton burchellii]|nr:hypothetical protein HN011_002299 [Eciton burchellii]
MKIQDKLISINDVTLKIRKELELIEELVKENGQLRTTIDTANETLSGKVSEMGLDVAKIVSESRGKLESDLLSSITAAAITEKLLSHMDG